LTDVSSKIQDAIAKNIRATQEAEAERLSGGTKSEDASDKNMAVPAVPKPPLASTKQPPRDFKKQADELLLITAQKGGSDLLFIALRRPIRRK